MPEKRCCQTTPLYRILTAGHPARGDPPFVLMNEIARFRRVSARTPRLSCLSRVSPIG